MEVIEINHYYGYLFVVKMVKKYSKMLEKSLCDRIVYGNQLDPVGLAKIFCSCLYIRSTKRGKAAEDQLKKRVIVVNKYKMIN